MSSMTIRVTIDGVSKDGFANMYFEIARCRPISRFNEPYFLSVLFGLRDTDEKAFYNALEAFFKHELEQDDDEE